MIRTGAFIFVHMLIGVYCNFDPSVKTGEKKLSFKTPQLTDEDNHSRFVPDEFRCDVCKAIAFQFYTHFDGYNQQNKKYKSDMPESELLDLTEKICKQKTFDPYGIKSVDGVNRLSGEGLESKDKPGIMTGGGMWPGRLSTLCFNFLGDLGEYEIYLVYREQPDDLHHFQNYLCFQSGLRGSCNVQKPKTEL